VVVHSHVRAAHSEKATSRLVTQPVPELGWSNDGSVVEAATMQMS
jgi:hypothetical protein